jgi:1A family penicillin-binding protein
MRRRLKTARIKQKIKTAILWAVLFGLIGAGLFSVWLSTLKIPDLRSFEERKVAESTKIFDRTGEVLLFDIHQDIRRTVVPFEEISNHIKEATLAVEDTQFYEHRGIQVRSTLRAIFVNLGSLRFRQGGSTITQQVVKNSLLTTEKKISRKIKEWVLAIKLENLLTKDEIFAMYLNESPYGGSIYGVEEASRAFFDKSAAGVTLAEAAYLAALPQAPSFYSPYRNRERLDERKNLVLTEMLRNNFITEEEYEEALQEEVKFKQIEGGIKAPHFVMFVRDILEEKYGQEVLESGGLRVITTLDYDMQKKAEKMAKEYALENEGRFNAENIALVAINPKDGQILTMVGSRDYFDEEIDGNYNVTTAYRQPGSAFKPFAYAAAFNKGYTPETTLFDLPTVFSANCTPLGQGVNCYAPQNYDNKFRGPVTMREALAQSINVPSVKTLYLAGLRNTILLAQEMGIQSLGDPNRYGLSLVLGSGEVSLLDLTSAYGVFANNGARAPHQAILEIKDRNGTVLEKPVNQAHFALKQETAWKISDILSDNVARTPAFGESSYLNFPDREVAVKTGTTNDYIDAWVIGYTPSIAVGAWAGNNNNTPMEKKVAGFIIAPFWNAFMKEVLAKMPKENFPKLPSENSFDLKPVLRGKWQGGESYLIDRISGKLATQWTPKESLEEILTGEIRTILYWLSKENPRGPTPQFPESDPQFNLWDYPVRQWALANGMQETLFPNTPEEFDDVHLPEYFPKVSINLSPPAEYFNEDQIISAELNIQSHFPVIKAEYFVDDIPLATLNAPGFNVSFSLSELNLDPQKDNEPYILKVIAYDNVLNRGTAEIEINLSE